ncbi:unnamed protein product [Tilletia controversa]|nr:unnamed protein product [Tilletia controversa]CAD6955890.1 unnamed protein product [Tilletia controversa]CAD6983081.1 unnamed protein product [Tilletia controversa]
MDTSQAEGSKSRVLVEGPGGVEVKQGARIACDNCRQAKIKCSAPSDGVVPCSRCTKAQKPCLFYKHQRGRKPGRLNNRTSHKDGGGEEHHGSSDQEDDDDSMPLAALSFFHSTPSTAPKASSAVVNSKPRGPRANKSGTSAASKAHLQGSSKARHSIPGSSGALSMPGQYPGFDAHSGAHQFPGESDGGRKRKRNNTDFRSTGPFLFTAHADSMGNPSPNFPSLHVGRAPSPAPSRGSTAGSTSAANQRNRRAGSTSVLMPPALLDRTSLSASASGSGTASRAGSRRNSASPQPNFGPGSPTSKMLPPLAPSGQHGQPGRHASPEEAALAANSLMWYSSAVSSSGTPATSGSAPVNRPQQGHNSSMHAHASSGGPSVTLSGMDMGIPAYTNPQSSGHQQPQSSASTSVPDLSIFENMGMLDPNSFMHAYPHLDYDRQRLLMPIYQAAQQQSDPTLTDAAGLGAPPGSQLGQAMDWQRRLQEQMQQASYDTNQIAAAAAVVQQISNVLVQQTQQHQQQTVQQLLSGKPTQPSHGDGAGYLGPGPVAAAPTATHGPGHITMPSHPPHPSHHSVGTQSMHHGSQQQQRGGSAIPSAMSPTTPFGAPPMLPNDSFALPKGYPTNPRNNPASAPLTGMPNYQHPFTFPPQQAPPNGAPGAPPHLSNLNNAHVGPPPSQAPHSGGNVNMSSTTPGMMPPPPPRHSASFQGFEAGQNRMAGAGPGAALHVGTGGPTRSGSFGDAMYSAGRTYGTGLPEGPHGRSQSFGQVYDSAFGYDQSQQQQPQQQHQQQQQQQNHSQLHMSGGKVHPSPQPGLGQMGGGGSMPPFVHGARGANRSSALKPDNSGSGITYHHAPGGTAGILMNADSGNGPNSRLRSLSNESGSGSGDAGPSLKRARMEGYVGDRPPRAIDEEDEEEEGNGEGEDAGPNQDEEIIENGPGREGGEGSAGEEDEDEDDDDDDLDNDDELSEEDDNLQADDHVLSNPLRLLAHASGAAAAMDSGEQYRHAAETMGLLCVRRDEAEKEEGHTDGDEDVHPEPGPEARPEPPSVEELSKREATLDFYRSSISATPSLIRSLTSPRSRVSDLVSLPSLVRNPPTSTSPSNSVAASVSTQPQMRRVYRSPRTFTDDPSWLLGPRRLTSSVAALVGPQRRFMRPGGPPLPDLSAYRSGPPPVPSSMSDSAIMSDSGPGGRGGSSAFHPNGLAAVHAARSLGGSANGSVHDDEGGAAADLDERRSQFPRRLGLSFESSASRSTGGSDKGASDERDGAHIGLGVRRSILSDTRRTSIAGIGPHSPVRHSFSQPLPIRPADLFRQEAGLDAAGDTREEDSRMTFSSQPEPLRKDSRHGTVTAENLKNLDRATDVAVKAKEHNKAGATAVTNAASKAVDTNATSKPAATSNGKTADSRKTIDQMDVDEVIETHAVASLKADASTTTLANKDASASGLGDVTMLSEGAVPVTALATPDLGQNNGPITGSADKSMGENPALSPAMSPPVRRRRNSLSLETYKEGSPAAGVFPSPVQQGYWEYKDGRAQTRRTHGGSVSSGSGVPFQGLQLLPGIGVRGGKAHTVAGGLTPAMKPTIDASNVQSPSMAGDGEFLPPPLLPRAILPLKKQPKSLVSFDRVDLSPHDAFFRRKRPRDISFLKKEKDRLKKKKSTAGMTDMSSRSKLTVQTRLQDDGKDEILPNMNDDESDDGIDGFKRGYFNVSLYHQKLDIEEESEDPVVMGYVELREVQRLFDVFFNNINPLLLVFDPFLHSVSYVRSRSAFLTTVIISLAARFVDTQRDAALAVSLEHLWLGKQLPLILSGGYKSVEISQAFIILAMFHKPTGSLADDRSWQYLGFAIRIATEIGVNRRIHPKDSVKSKEQVRRRVRNRERLWCNLFLCDRIMSAQTGRPWTISDDLLSPEASGDWHTQDFALPFDAVVVSMIRLRRTIARHSTQLDAHLAKEHLSLDKDSSALSYLEFLRHGADTDLIRWRDSWSEPTDSAQPESAESVDWGPFSTHWTALSKLYHQHSWLHLNSYVLQALEKYETVSSSVYKDCWTSALELIKITLQLGEAKLMYAPNHVIVMAVYAAVSVLRLLNRDKSKHPWVNRDEAVSAVRALITTLSNAGKTPQHRNGAAVPYAKYLTSVLALWDPPPKKGAEEGKKSKDPPRAASPNRLRSVSDAAAIMRPRDREATSVSGTAIIMPTTTERECKPERNSLDSTRLLPSTAMMQRSTFSPARPSISAAVPGLRSAPFPNLPLSTPEASMSTPGQLQTHPHPHPINFDSLGAWAGGVNALRMPATPTGETYRPIHSAPITAMSTPALGGDTSGDLSSTGIDMNVAMNAAGSGMAANSGASGLGQPFMGIDMSSVSGLNMTGVKFPTDARPPFMMSGPHAPSTSSTAAAPPGSAGPTMMRAPHQHRHVSGGHTVPTGYVQSDGATAGGGITGNTNGAGLTAPGEAFLDDANWTLPMPGMDATGMDPTIPAEGVPDRFWDYVTSWDGSANGVTSGFWQPQPAPWNFTY